MENDKKTKGKAVKLPETESQDTSLPTKETIEKAQDLARRTSPLALAMFEADSTDED